MALVPPFHSENEVHCGVVRDYAERPPGHYGDRGLRDPVQPYRQYGYLSPQQRRPVQYTRNQHCGLV